MNAQVEGHSLSINANCGLGSGPHPQRRWPLYIEGESLVASQAAVCLLPQWQGGVWAGQIWELSKATPWVGASSVIFHGAGVFY